MDTFKKIKNSIFKYKLFNANTPLMLMVSGGSDSVALCYAVDKLQHGLKNFALMHLNHNLRVQANEDAAFVERLAEYFNVDCYTFSDDVCVLAKNKKQNLEALGRKLRYQHANEAVQSWAKKNKFLTNEVVICTAHTADDRIENFYMRSIVGTGPGGFAGIKRRNKNIARPLLDIQKNELCDWLKSIEEPFKDESGALWHEDLTNTDINRFRAYVRHEIIPKVKSQNPKMVENLCRSMDLIADEDEYINNLANNSLLKYIKIYDHKFKIKPGFNDLSKVIKKRCVYNALKAVFPPDSRIENKSINSILQACCESNYTDNIQNNYSVHSNKSGVLVQTMEEYRKSRNKI